MVPKPSYAVAVRCAVALLSACVLLIVFNSCSSSPPKRRGIKLSDASAEAAKKPEEQKPMRKDKEKKDQKEENEEEDTIYIEAQPLIDDTEPTIDYTVEESVNSQPLDYVPAEPVMFRPHFGLTAGGGSLRGDQLDGFGAFGIVLGMDFVDRHWYRLDVSGLYITTNRTEDNTLSSGLVREYELALDLAGRYYFTPKHTFMGLYTLGGIRLGYLFWDYRSPIVVSEPLQTETIKSDRLGYFSAFIGLGVNLVQVKNVHIGANLSLGYKIYEGITNEGFDNDIFDSEPMIQLMFDFSFITTSELM